MVTKMGGKLVALNGFSTLLILMENKIKVERNEPPSQSFTTIYRLWAFMVLWL